MYIVTKTKHPSAILILLIGVLLSSVSCISQEVKTYGVTLDELQFIITYNSNVAILYEKCWSDIEDHNIWSTTCESLAKLIDEEESQQERMNIKLIEKVKLKYHEGIISAIYDRFGKEVGGKYLEDSKIIIYYGDKITNKIKKYR